MVAVEDAAAADVDLLGSGVVDLERPVDRGGVRLEIVRIRADHDVVAPECTFDDGHVDNIGGPGSSAKDAKMRSRLVGEARADARLHPV